MAAAAVEFYGRPVARAHRRRSHRHERQDDDVLPPLRDPRRRRPPARAARDDREPRRRRAAAGPAHDAGGDRRAAGAAGRCSTWATGAARWRPRRTVARSDGSTGVRFSALGFTNLSRDHLDFHGTLERVLRGEAAACSSTDDPPPAAVNADDAHGRRLAGELREPRRTSAWSRSVLGPTRTSAPKGSSWPRDGASFTAAGISATDAACSADSTSRTCSRRSAVARLLELPDDAISRGIEAVRGVPGPFRGGRRGAAVLRASSTTHTRRTRSRTRYARRGSSRRAASSASSAAAAIAITASGRSWAQSRASGRRRRDRHLRQPAQRGAARDRRRRSRTALAAEVDVELDRATAIERAIETGAPGRHRAHRRQGARAGPGGCGRDMPFDDREVAREALRRLAARA